MTSEDDEKSAIESFARAFFSRRCGDPNCKNCKGRGEDLSSEGQDRISFQVVSFGGGDTSALPDADDATSERREAESAERAARQPVEQFILRGDLQVSWDDILGNEEAHAAMVDAIELPAKHSEMYQFYSRRPTKGILLSGPPGCGKTMFGKAAASVISRLYSNAEVAMLSIKATQLQSPFVGQTEATIRSIFAYAKAYSRLHKHPLVIFIDEADAILPSRGGTFSRAVHSFEESNVSTFLTEMDGVEESGALVILATNRPQAIDTALLRDGRCDRKIVVKRPNPEVARQIFTKALASAPVVGDREQLIDLAMDEFFHPLRKLMKVKTERGVDFLTLGHTVSGAMMVGLVERAKAKAFLRDVRAKTQTGVSREDILAAVQEVFDEGRRMPDGYALQDLAEQLGTEIIEVDTVRDRATAPMGTLQ